MPLRHTFVALLLPAALALAAQPAHAGRPVPTLRPIAGAPAHASTVPARAVDTACQLGVTGPPVWVVGYAIPPEDQYYTLIDADGCECGGSGGVLVSAAHVQLEFWDDYSVNPVRVGLVAADMSDPECPVPIRGQYLCAPVQYDLVPPGVGLYDVSLPLGAACCIAGKAFLEFTFVDWNEWWAQLPGLVLTDGCEPCTSYNYYPGNGYDLCTFGFEGNPVMYVDAACCGAVPARRDSWGRLKTLYR